MVTHISPFRPTHRPTIDSVLECALVVGVPSYADRDGPYAGRTRLLPVVRDGFFKALYPRHDRLEIFWSLCFGVMGFFLGQLISWSEAQGKRTPAFLGWELLGLALLGAALMPISGWWLVMVSGVLTVVGSPHARTA